MPKVAKEISPLQLKRLSEPGLHAVGGAPGLYLQIGKSTTSRSWILRISVAGKRRDIGLGSYPTIGLANAREQARAYGAQIHAGVDPVEAKRLAKRKEIEARARRATFKELALKYIDSQKAGWRHKKHHQQWSNSLVNYAFPIIGAMPVAEIELRHVTQILEPIWYEKSETAKVR